MLGPYSTYSNLMIYKLDDRSLSASSSRWFPLYVCCRFVGLVFVLFCFGVWLVGFFPLGFNLCLSFRCSVQLLSHLSLLLTTVRFLISDRASRAFMLPPALQLPPVLFAEVGGFFTHRDYWQEGKAGGVILGFSSDLETNASTKL